MPCSFNVEPAQKNSRAEKVFDEIFALWHVAIASAKSLALVREDMPRHTTFNPLGKVVSFTKENFDNCIPLTVCFDWWKSAIPVVGQ